MATLSGCNWNTSTGDIDPELQALLSQMTVEQKVGQMTQLNLGFLSTSTEQHDGKPKEVDWAKVQEAVQKYHVGSILNSNGYAKPLEEWHQIINGIQQLAADTEHGIPVLYGIDAIHGATYIENAVLFPHNIALAATRDRSLVKDGAEATASLTRASGIRWNFDPVFDVGREPLWPRFEETFGESALLCGEMGSQVVKGYEGDDLQTSGVASCLKHFIGYSVPESGKDRTEAYISGLEMWEQHIPSFQAGIDAGASTVMLNSASVNGAPIHASRQHVTELLRHQMGFEGMVVSDWEDIIRLHTRHHLAVDLKEAVLMAIEAGLDMSMVPNDYSFHHLLVELVESGEVSEARLDDSVYRILTLKKKLGLFENPGVEPGATEPVPNEADLALAQRAAEASLVLLENRNDVLPLKDGGRILVVGPTCCSKPVLHGGWSYSWQGRDATAYPEATLTLADALRQEFGENRITCPVEAPFHDAGHRQLEINGAAEGCEAIVLCLGEASYAETPGVIDDLTLSADQIELAKAAHETGKPVVLVLIEGRGRLVSPIADDMDAILLSMRPGSAGAAAIAGVLSGRVNPSGTLPFTYQRNSGDILPHDHRTLSRLARREVGPITRDGFQPQWAFGHGMTYSDLNVTLDSITSKNSALSDTIVVHCSIENKSERDAVKPLDVFVSDLYASTISPRVRVHVDFDRIPIPARQKVQAQFKLPPQCFSYVDGSGTRHSEPGRFSVELGCVSDTIVFTLAQ